MTDITKEAPERIWVDLEANSNGPMTAYKHAGSWPGVRVEYVRADTLPASPAPVWRDMDSAPKDGTEVLGRHHKYEKRIRLMWFFEASSRTKSWRDENGNQFKPGAWMPLPGSQPTEQPPQADVQGVNFLKRVAAYLALNAHITDAKGNTQVAHNMGVDTAIAEILKLSRNETALRVLAGEEGNE